MTGCERCDTHGPDHPTIQAAALDVHRALHNIWNVTLGPSITRLLERITR
ncbi:hypothetical protein [Timonella senegalensis]|nr:hypothetical protein [Timonella senegalensis]